MYTIIDTNKSFEAACADLEAAVKNNGFGVLHVHDLGLTLRSKGFQFSEQCRVFEVCNPGQASKVLSLDIRLNMALPCRISVYTEAGCVKLGYIQPVDMLGALSSDPALKQIAGEVEASMSNILDEAK